MPSEKFKKSDKFRTPVQVKKFKGNLVGMSQDNNIKVGDIDIRKIRELRNNSFQVNTYAIHDPERDISIQIEDSQRIGKYNPQSKYVLLGSTGKGKGNIITQNEFSRNGDLLAETTINITDYQGKFQADKKFDPEKIKHDSSTLVRSTNIDKLDKKFRWYMIPNEKIGNKGTPADIKTRFSRDDLDQLAKHYRITLKKHVKDQKLWYAIKIKNSIENEKVVNKK